MTPERIKELRAVIAKATEGPFAVVAGANSAFFDDRIVDDRIVDRDDFCIAFADEPDATLITSACNTLPAALDTIEAQAARIVEIEAAISWARDTLGEINVSNYNHDDVCSLNEKSVEVILGLAALTKGE